MTNVMHKLLIYSSIYFCLTEGTLLVAQLVDALRFKPEGRGIDTPMVSLEFFIDIVLPAAL
jgi:hypothetical protein